MGVLETLLSVFDERSWIETSIVAVGSSLTTVFYILHNNYADKARKVDDAPVFDINEHLNNIVEETPDSTIPYAVITGSVYTYDTPITSKNNPDIKGVSWKLETTEHKDVWSKYSNQWNSQKRQIASVTNTVPIILCDPAGLSSVKLNEPEVSGWFNDTLQVIHEKFTPSNESTMHSFMNFISGERLKGFTEAESMLPLKTKLCAVGELIYEDNELKIQAPKNGDYIITNQLPSEIIKHFRKSSVAWKIAALIMAGATMTSLYYLARRLWKRYQDVLRDIKTKEEMLLIRSQRKKFVDRSSQGTINEGDLCVVCLTNPREVVLLDCGHVCICIDCLEALPSPLKCPVCRAPVVRTVPLFIA